MTITEKFKKLKETNPKYKDLNLNGGKITNNFKKQVSDFIGEYPSDDESKNKNKTNFFSRLFGNKK